MPDFKVTTTRTLAVFLLLFVSAIELAAGNEPDSLHRVVIWEAGENGAEGYRIPGIVVTVKGTLLAFAEERPLFGDEDPKSLVMKRSTDAGRSWSENHYLEKCDGRFWEANAGKIDPLDHRDKKEVWTNVAPIVDRITGRIFFFYALSEGAVAGQNLQRYTRVFFRYSDDDGLSWSERDEITEVLNCKEDGSPNQDDQGNWVKDSNGFPCDFMGRAFHMPGPGHGIQLSNGRLLLQVWNRTALGGLNGRKASVADRRYGLSMIYSDDHGKSWKYGSAFGHGEFHMNESRMAELANGDVYLNARYVPATPGEKNNFRMTAISHDSGISWEKIGIDRNFPASSPCDAGLAVLRGSGDGPEALCYSKNESTNGRENLVLRVSRDGGKTWPVAHVIDNGPAWYSDLAVLPDQSVYLIYETGKNSPVYGVRLSPEMIRVQANGQ
jgi:hypothetical protein